MNDVALTACHVSDSRGAVRYRDSLPYNLFDFIYIIFVGYAKGIAISVGDTIPRRYQTWTVEQSFGVTLME